MKFLNYVAIFISLFIFSSCVTAGQRVAAQRSADIQNAFRNTPELFEAGKQLVEDYLKGQLQGEDSSTAWEKYGTGETFLNLMDFKILNAGFNRYNNSVVFFRVKAGNKAGGVFWSNYEAFLDLTSMKYFQVMGQKVPSETDFGKYNGVKISFLFQGR